MTEDNEEGVDCLELTDNHLQQKGTNEDYSKFRAEGFDVDDDNGPAPENTPDKNKARVAMTEEEDSNVKDYDTK